jgi:hypothetical protein
MGSETNATLNNTIRAIERLLALFRLERFIHLIIGILSFLMLVYAISLLVRDTKMTPELATTLFGSTGLITLSSARITYFFNKAFALIEEIIRKGLTT